MFFNILTSIYNVYREKLNFINEIYKFYVLITLNIVILMLIRIKYSIFQKITNINYILCNCIFVNWNKLLNLLSKQIIVSIYQVNKLILIISYLFINVKIIFYSSGKKNNNKTKNNNKNEKKNTTTKTQQIAKQKIIKKQRKIKRKIMTKIRKSISKNLK